MKKSLIALALAVLILIPTASATDAYTQQEKTADAMNHLGLFIGDGISYKLDDLVKRHDGTTMLVRMLGKESEAQTSEDFGMPFDDVPSWAKGYIGYAWKNGLVNGMSKDGDIYFGPTEIMTHCMFLTLTLRALGYSDSGEHPEFKWNNPYALAKEVGLLDTAEADEEFTRGDAVEVFWNALDAKLKGTDMTLGEKMIHQGVFTATEFAQAREIQSNGRNIFQGIPAKSQEIIVPTLPMNPDTSLDAENPTTPEDDSSINSDGLLDEDEGDRV